MIGVVVMWTTAVIIAYITGGRDLTNFNIQLLTPIAQKWIPRKYRHTQLKVINIVKDDEQIYADKNLNVLTHTCG